MDRNIVYPSSIPQDVDILNVNRNVMVAFGYLTQMVAGTGAAAAGLGCTATGTLYANIGAGCLTTYTVVDATAYGSLPADTSDPLVKMGINLQQTALLLTAPATSGTSLNWLIEAQVVEADGAPVVLPFVNAANPLQPYSGPSNSGAASNTIRTQRVALQAIAGAPATSGSQVAPAATPGWVGLWVVTVAYGQTSLVAGNIAPSPTAPFVQFPLPQLRPGFTTAFIPSASSGNWVAPPGVSLIRATLTGGGGAGGNGGGGPGSTYVGGGGAGGGYVRATFAVTPGQSLSYFIGAGGVPGGGSGAGGSTGLASLAAATGGSGGSAGSAAAVGPGAAAGGSGSANGAIGSVLTFTGNGGQAGLSAGSIALGGSGGGGEGRAVGTTNPSYAATSSGSGIGGFGHGDGGSGAVGTGTGGTGAAGFLVIEF